MTPLDNGGPAFPLYVPGYNVDLEKLKGMTLLDYFAGQAMTGIFSSQDIVQFLATNPVGSQLTSEGAKKVICHTAYETASAMLKVRKVYLKHTGLEDLKVGDLVSVKQWDRYERNDKKVGTPATVTKVELDQYSESTVMVTVVGTSGRSVRLDRNWLRPYPVKEDEP